MKFSIHNRQTPIAAHAFINDDSEREFHMPMYLDCNDGLCYDGCMKSDDELKQIAIDIVEGRIYTSWSIPKNRQNNLFKVFKVLAHTQPETLEYWGRNPATAPVMFYAKASDVTSMDDTLPSFDTASYLVKDEADRLLKFLAEGRSTNDATQAGI